MSPLRKKRLARFKKTRTGSSKSRLKKLFILGILASVFYFLFMRSNHFGKLTKLSFVSPLNAGDVAVTTIDRRAGEITTVYIPGDTEVAVVRQLGTWRIKSVWQLGINEKVGGRLLADTVTKNFKFPILAWTDTEGLGLVGEDLGSKLRAIFYSYDTNLGFGDKVSLALFFLGVRNLDRVEVDLADTPYIKRTRLKDGNVGYMIFGQIPQNLLVVFADGDMIQREIRIILKNESGFKSLSSDVAKVLEVLGGKVVANIDKNEEKKDCEVLAKDEGVAQKISSLLACRIVDGAPEGAFDLELRIGSEFARRF